MMLRCRKGNVLAAVAIMAALGIICQLVWIPSIARSIDEDPVDRVVASGQSAELYGVVWRIQELRVPDAPSKADLKMPTNGRVVGFLFERSRDGALIESWNRDHYPPCIAYIYDTHMRRWSSGTTPVEAGRWADRNGYAQSCMSTEGAGKYALIAIVPRDAQLSGVEVLFKESPDKIVAVRFDIG